MDDITPGIVFYADGTCNYCRQHDELAKMYPVGGFDPSHLPRDVVVGVSGGMDSSLLLHLAVEEWDLSPIAVTYDNGWASDTAKCNLDVVTSVLDVPLVTVHADTNDVFRAFMEAGLPEIEAATDSAFMAALYSVAAAKGIKHIMIGSSFRTEGITPHGMFYFDAKYVDNVYKSRAGPTAYPGDMLWLRPWLKWIVCDRIKRLNPLYYVDYDVYKTRDMLFDEYGWNWYDGHHRDNVFTEFCDNYWLPVKFGIDLRKVEYSALVRSHQMERDEALAKLEVPPSIGANTIDIVCSKLGITRNHLDSLITAIPGSRDDYATYKPTFKRMKPFFWLAAKMGLVPMSFYQKYCH